MLESKERDINTGMTFYPSEVYLFPRLKRVNFISLNSFPSKQEMLDTNSKPVRVLLAKYRGIKV